MTINRTQSFGYYLNAMAEFNHFYVRTFLFEKIKCLNPRHFAQTIEASFEELCFNETFKSH